MKKKSGSHVKCQCLLAVASRPRKHSPGSEWKNERPRLLLLPRCPASSHNESLFTVHWSLPPLFVHTQTGSVRCTRLWGFVGPLSLCKQRCSSSVLLHSPRKYDALAIRLLPMPAPSNPSNAATAHYDNARLACALHVNSFVFSPSYPQPNHTNTALSTKTHPKLVDAPSPLLKMVAREVHPPTYTPTNPALEKDGIIYEYGSAANPTVTPVPYLALGSSHHEEGKSLIAAADDDVSVHAIKRGIGVGNTTRHSASGHERSRGEHVPCVFEWWIHFFV